MQRYIIVALRCALVHTPLSVFFLLKPISTIVSATNMASNETTLPTREKFLEFGGSLKTIFPFDKEWTNLNHGMVPTVSQDNLR